MSCVCGGICQVSFQTEEPAESLQQTFGHGVVANPRRDGTDLSGVNQCSPVLNQPSLEPQQVWRSGLMHADCC